ncbi:hypothetical protein AB0K08_13645 [Citricoccus sp. NPDC055426]|uniref:hypothetical protein n=1 Tax=Citricoccus sp. NPDC055426 TaxID=3155536 RepID=UPI00342E44EF
MPFVSTDKDAGPDGMIHLSAVPSGGLMATAYGNAPAVAWVAAESLDGELASFAMDRQDAKTIAGNFRKAIGDLLIDVEAKVLKSVVQTNVVMMNGETMDGREERPETAYSITVTEDSGLFGNRMVKVATAAQPEANLSAVWAALLQPLVSPVPPMEEYHVAGKHLGMFRPAEREYEASLTIEPATLAGALLVRVGADFIGLANGTGATERDDEDRRDWMERIPVPDKTAP